MSGDTRLEIGVEQLRYLRMKSQRLLRSTAWEGVSAAPDSPVEVLKAVCGVQAQDFQAGLLSMRARSEGLTARLVMEAGFARKIAWTWAMRGTLHLISSGDARWLIPFLGQTFIPADQRRMEQLGWDEERTAKGLKLLRTFLDEFMGLSRSEVTKYLKSHQLPFEGQAPVHLIYRAAFECMLSIVPEWGRYPIYSPFRFQVGKPLRLAREEALARLAIRYLEGYGPASPEDMAGWTGLKISEVRQTWDMIEDQITAITVATPAVGTPKSSGKQTMWMLKSRLSWLDEPLPSSPVVRLLPAYDTFLLGYANRDRIVDRLYARRVHPGGGQIRPVLLVDGRAVGAWKSRLVKSFLEIRVQPFEPLDESLLPLIEAEVADIGRFLEKKSKFVYVDPDS